MEREEPRVALVGDVDAVRSVTAQAYALYTPLLGGLPLPVTEDYGPRIAAGQVWILEDSGGPYGVLVLERHPDHVMIFSIAVAPERQSRGVGRQLLAFAEARAREWCVPEVRLYTNARLERNVGIYAAAGYREAARRPHPFRVGQVVVDMAKPVLSV